MTFRKIRPKHTLLLLALIYSSVFLFSQASCPKWGPYIGAYYKKDAKADLCMADVMIPYEGLAPYTYTCVLQFKIGKSGGYCGLQYMDSSKGRKNNNIFSIWDFPGKKQIVHTYKSPITYVDGFGNEGTGLHSHADFAWVAGQWYTLVVRRWASDDTSKTNVAFFIYDHAQKEWMHYVTFLVPQGDAMLNTGTSGFLENFSDRKKSPRFSYYKSYWAMLPNGSWVKPDSLRAGAGEGYWDVKAYGDDGIQLHSCGPEFLIKPKVSFPVQSLDVTPKADIIKPVEVFDAAQYFDKDNNILYVNWIIKEGTSPQLKYKASLYMRGQDDPLRVIERSAPEARSVSMNVPKLDLSKNKYYVKLQLTDIFGQPAEPFSIRLRELKE